MLKQHLQLKLSQKLSPQQIQLMKLMQLSTLDFEQRLQYEIEQNPALEKGKENKDDDDSLNNEFEENFFYQPLLKWNPNPFTIFYIGGTNGYSILNTNNKYGIENSQLYFKFQYQFDL